MTAGLKWRLPHSDYLQNNGYDKGLPRRDYSQNNGYDGRGSSACCHCQLHERVTQKIH